MAYDEQRAAQLEAPLEIETKDGTGNQPGGLSIDFVTVLQAYVDLMIPQAAHCLRIQPNSHGTLTTDNQTPVITIRLHPNSDYQIKRSERSQQQRLLSVPASMRLQVGLVHGGSDKPGF